jgi:hypothetical protein
LVHRQMKVEVVQRFLVFSCIHRKKRSRSLKESGFKSS